MKYKLYKLPISNHSMELMENCFKYENDLSIYYDPSFFYLNQFVHFYLGKEIFFNTFILDIQSLEKYSGFKKKHSECRIVNFKELDIINLLLNSIKKRTLLIYNVKQESSGKLKKIQNIFANKGKNIIYERKTYSISSELRIILFSTDLEILIENCNIINASIDLNDFSVFISYHLLTKV